MSVALIPKTKKDMFKFVKNINKDILKEYKKWRNKNGR